MKLKTLLKAGAIATPLAVGAGLAREYSQLPDVDGLYDMSRSIQMIIKKSEEEMPNGVTDVIAGIPLEYSEMPNHVRNALIAREDQKFYDHFGFDLKGMARAFLDMIGNGKVISGGSTITQQLAKKSYLSDGGGLQRKLKEILLAIKIEQEYSKDEIITMYLNTAPFGQRTHGIQEASLKYFGKDAKELSVYEAALLIGSLVAPETQNFEKDLETANVRAIAIINAMKEEGHLPADYQADTTIRKGEKSPGSVQSRPLYESMRGRLQEIIGDETGAFTVITTIDPTLQRIAEDTVETNVQKLHAKGYPQSDGALVAIDYAGAIKARVANSHWGNGGSFHDFTRVPRQTGSSFKPVVYLAALENEYTPDSPVSGKRINIDGWEPKNYDGWYPSSLSLAEALSHSVNTSAVRLMQEVGKDAVDESAKRLGLNNCPEKENDYTRALGTCEEPLTNMTGAYSVFANEGVQNNPHMILGVRNKKADILYWKGDEMQEKAIPTETAKQMTTMLKAVVEERTGKKNAYIPNRELAGKTGTTQKNQDTWFVGYDVRQRLTAGVWVGRDGKGSSGTSGPGVPAKIFHDFMLAIDGKYSFAEEQAKSMQTTRAPEVDAKLQQENQQMKEQMKQMEKEVLAMESAKRQLEKEQEQLQQKVEEAEGTRQQNLNSKDTRSSLKNKTQKFFENIKILNFYRFLWQSLAVIFCLGIIIIGIEEAIRVHITNKKYRRR